MRVLYVIGSIKFMRLNLFRKHNSLILITVLLITMSKTITPTDGYLDPGSYKNLEGEIVSFDSFEGSHLLVFAMATWCAPCKEQHHEIAEIYKMNYTNFEILTLSIDPNDTVEKMIEYQDSYGNPWATGINSNESSLGNLDISAIPTLLFFNPEGRLLFQKTGYTEFEELNEAIGGYIPTQDSLSPLNDTSATTSNTLTIGYSAYSVISLFIFSTIFMVVGFRRYKH